MTIQDMERLIATTLHSGNKFMDYGTGATTTITFNHKFVSEPCIILTVIGTAGETAEVVTKDKTGAFYTGATITTTGTSVDWIAIGTGIAV
jgi:hypothetical protein